MTNVLDQDSDLHVDVALWGYTTHLFRRSPSVDEAAAQLRTELRLRTRDYGGVVLVAHSMGGLIVRAAVIAALQEGHVEDCHPIRHVVLLGTPNDGLDLARVIGRFNRQVAALRIDGQTVTDLRTEWMNRVYAPSVRPGEERTKMRIPVTTVVGLDDRLVPPESARSFFRMPPPESVPGDHRSMKDPENADDTVYLLIKRAVRDAHDDLVRRTVGATDFDATRPNVQTNLQGTLQADTQTAVDLPAGVLAPSAGADPGAQMAIPELVMRTTEIISPDGETTRRVEYFSEELAMRAFRENFGEGLRGSRHDQ